MSGATHLIDQAKFSSRPLSVLIADEDRAVRESCRQAAEGMGFAAAAAEDFPALLRRLSLRVTDLVVAGIDLPGAEFPAMVSSIMALQPGVEVVLTGPQSSPDSILHAIKSGHHGFLPKPFKVQEFLSLLQKVAARRQFPSAFPATDGHVKGAELIGQSPLMVRLQRMIERAASSKHPVLILGEKGSGKSSLARMVHSGGSLRDQPFIELNCSSSVAELESALFGSGPATAEPPALAVHGTVFLESVPNMPMLLQAKLLRALQEKELRIAGGKVLPVEARVIAATHLDLEAAVQHGTFRRDLYLRLNVVALRLPPLRERQEDIPALVDHFLAACTQPGRLRLALSHEAMRLILSYAWPGNVRELQEVIWQAAASLSNGSNGSALITPAHLPAEIQVRVAAQPPPSDHGSILPLAEVERKAILETLQQLNGNKQMAAQLLGIGKTTLYRKLKEYGIGRRLGDRP